MTRREGERKRRERGCLHATKTGWFRTVAKLGGAGWFRTMAQLGGAVLFTGFAPRFARGIGGAVSFTVFKGSRLWITEGGEGQSTILSAESPNFK